MKAIIELVDNGYYKLTIKNGLFKTFTRDRVRYSVAIADAYTYLTGKPIIITALDRDGNKVTWKMEIEENFEVDENKEPI